MGVDVHRHADIRMAHQVLEGLRIHPGSRLVAAVSMAADVRGDVGHLHPEDFVVPANHTVEAVLPVHPHRKDAGKDRTGQPQLRLATDNIAEVLKLRLQAAKSSVKKYTAMQSSACDDGRCHGMFSFYGASRTGRFAGRIVQLQNLRRNSMPDLEQARELVRRGDYGMLSLLYDSVPDVLSELVRTAFIPAPGMKFVVADFSAIEARVLAYLAGEQWVLDVFKSGGDIYCETASRMFGVPVEKHGRNAELRQKGKQAVLSCGYGGSVGALRAMGTLEAGMKEDELQPLVDSYREANPHIVKLWRDADAAVKKAIRGHTSVKVGLITYEARNGMLFAHLPSGRRLSYVKPQIGINRFGGESVTYMGVDSTKHWSRIETFGGKLTENCLAGETPVLTSRGLVPIKDITPDMRIWDGEEWVCHEGIIYQGRKHVVIVGGIKMTPEHKVFTEEGWIEGGKADGFNWADVSLTDGYPTCREQPSGEITVALSLCMREGSYNTRQSSPGQKISREIMRLHETQTDQLSSDKTRYEQASRLGSMAFDEAALPRPKPSCLSQLWCQRNNCVQPLAGQLREFLGGHGAHLAKRPRAGQDRQQCRIQSGELSLDKQEAKLQKQAEHQNDQDTVLVSSPVCSNGPDRNKQDNASVQTGSWLAGRITVYETRSTECVYDIRNCGPRHRFAVWNGKRLCIVSNCVQAVARDILCCAMQTLSRFRIVAHVHDEVIIEAGKDVSVQEICEEMGRTPPWVPGLLLRADGYECSFYKKD